VSERAEAGGFPLVLLLRVKLGNFCAGGGHSLHMMVGLCRL